MGNQSLGSAAENFPKKRIGLPITALAFDLATLLFLGLFFLWNPFIIFIALLGFIFSPIIGIILGVMAICQGKERIGRTGMTLAIIAVALPVLAVLILILLFSTGVAVISLM